MKKYDGLSEEDILSEIWDDVLEDKIDYITDEDITKMILVEYFLLGVPEEEILSEWELTKEEFRQILKENPVTYEELEEFKKEFFEEK